MPVLETHDDTVEEEKAHLFDTGFVSILHVVDFLCCIKYSLSLTCMPVYMAAVEELCLYLSCFDT